MRRTFHIRNVIRNPQASRLSSENYGLPDQIPSEMKQSPDASSLNQLISMLTTFISANISSKPAYVSPKHQYQLEARDREVSIDLPTVIDKVKPSELKLWITDVVKTIFSSAFNSVSKNQMSFEQAKIYCSQNIFKNIVRLSEKYRLSNLELELIDNHIKKGVLNYLAAKYPLTDQTLVNKKLQAVVRQIDNIEQLSNNYFTNSKIVFDYRQSGNYNDLIMEMLNDLMSKPEMTSNEQTTNYQDFMKYMSNIFQRVEDQDWVKKQDKEQYTFPLNHSSLNLDITLENNETKEEIRERIRIKNEEKEKYRAKVKDYTHYLIGRKISENAPLFTAAEIENGNIQIKNPQILRILTKWCEELQQKYSNNYFSNRQQGIKAHRGQKIFTFSPRLRQMLDFGLANTKKSIDQTMNSLFKNNYEMQASVLQNEMERQGDEHVDAIQKIGGKFSYKIVKNLHSYIIIYLNKLIHGLLRDTKNFYANLKQYTLQPSSPNLLSFKVGDLMRCKCSSKEKEILRIYEEITRVSKEHPQKLKIVRIKNRLRSGTNDILMNVRFNDSILCEIQLAIKTTTSEFIKCSNKFHHYLYELQRSLFGPLTQLGSIWNSLDKRAEIYQQLVKQEQNESKVLLDHACQKLNKNYEMNPYDKSFVCSSCKLSYFHNRFIMSHVQCSTCSYILCAKCRIEEQAKSDLKGLLGKQDKFIDVCGQMVPRESELPNFGLCVFIEAKQPKVQSFTFIKYKNIDYLLRKKGSGINQILKIRSQKEKEKLRKNFLFFEIKSNSTLKPIQQNQAINKYILPLIMKQNYKKEKEKISLLDLKLSNEESHSILSVGSHSQKQSVKKINLQGNFLTELPFKPMQFPNVQEINLSLNKMKSLEGIEQISRLKSLHMFGCELNQIDYRITKLNNLQTLSLGSNKFTCLPQILFECKALQFLSLESNNLNEIPQNIRKLSNLEVLSLSRTSIAALPQSIGELTNLKQLLLTGNTKLASLPSRFAELRNLQFLNITNTSIRKIPWPQAKLTQLKAIRIENGNIQDAHFSSLPELSFEKLSYQNMKTLEISDCNLAEVPTGISNMKNLRNLNLNVNQIKDWKDSLSKLNLLESLNIFHCNLTNFSNLSNCCNLKTLSISSNALTSIPAENIEGLVNLEDFNCRKNALTVLPTSLTKLKKLRKLDAGENKLETLFDPEFQSRFDGTQYWPELNTVTLFQNKLQAIPLPLCYCPKLQNLKITENQIKSIPPEIRNSSYINFLDLSQNGISEIPDELSALTKLSYINLSFNKIVRVPLFIQNFTNLMKFDCYSYNYQIETIQCLDWVLNNSTIDFSNLKKTAKDMKEKQLDAQKMRSLEQNP